ncbi:MAG: C25 family cysteine peptidase [Salinivirgaceae bacterium]|jgi:hypothetical protein|nr:T9SS type A sorting domain-containing protein [Bacteroidales bacterium]
MQPKRIIIFIAAILILIVSPKVFANQTKVKVLQSTESKIVLQVEFSEPQFTSVETPRGKAFVVSADKAYPILSEGMPDVPRVAESIIIPDLGTMEISVIDVDCRIIDNIEIAPSKGNILRTVNPEDVPYIYGEAYQIDKFFPEKNASLDTPYILRDYRGQVVAFYPVQYNPVTKQLRVNKTVKVTLVHSDIKGENELIRNNPTRVNSTFDQIYRNRFLNYENNERYTPVNEVGKLLIVSHSSYMEAIQPFVAWKKQIGIPTELVEWSTIGTTHDQLKAYVQNYYNTNGLTFLLLVGDGEQVPPITKNISGTSPSPAYCDPSYGHIVGNDAYAEVIVGRFSVETVQQLQNQIQKTIMYESQPDANADWYKKYTLIASAEGGGGQGDNGESDVAHSRVIKQKLLGYNYTSGDELFDGTQGQEDAPGNPTPQMVVDALNQGRGFMNYTGHGSETSLGSSGFSVSSMSGLSNNTQFPFMFDVACVNGRFVGRTCFAEGFMRASNANGPTGSLAICASSVNQSWAPPMAGQDEMVDLLVKSYQNNKKYTFGGIVVNGCMFMNDKYGTGGYSMTETWVIFGDPTVMVRTDTPQTLEVSHNNIIFLGTTEFEVECASENTRATLSVDGELIASANIVGGTATLTFSEPFNEPAMAKLTVTGYNKVPYIADIEVIPAEGPYISVESYNTESTDNVLIPYGQVSSIDVSFKNMGVEEAVNCIATISTENENVTLLNSTFEIGNVGANEIVTKHAAFDIEVVNNIPNMELVLINITITDNLNNIWTGKIKLNAAAPYIEVTSITFEEYHGNDNDQMDAGEIWKAIVTTKNNGEATSAEIETELSAMSDNFQIIEPLIHSGVIEPNEELTTVHTLILDGNIPAGNFITTFAISTSDQYTSNILTVSSPVGLIIEDFETEDFSSFNWQVPSSNAWQILTGADNAYEGNACMTSGTTANSQTKEITLNHKVSKRDMISFYRKVSSETNYDKLTFSINNVVKETWSGELDWAYVEFPVNVGDSLFTWKYTKDGSAASGQDKAWIDYIVLPSSATSTQNNVAPIFLTTPPGQVVEVMETKSFEYIIEGYDEDAEDTELIFTCVDKPDWLTLEQTEATKAVLSGTVAAEDVGKHDIVILQVSDTKTASTQYFFVRTIPYVGIEESLVVLSKMTIYPNPANNTVNISFESPGKKELVVELFSIDGAKKQTIFDGTSHGGTNNITANIDDLNPGLYFVRITLEGKTYTNKLIVK